MKYKDKITFKSILADMQVDSQNFERTTRQLLESHKIKTSNEDTHDELQGYLDVTINLKRELDLKKLSLDETKYFITFKIIGGELDSHRAKSFIGKNHFLIDGSSSIVLKDPFYELTFKLQNEYVRESELEEAIATRAKELKKEHLFYYENYPHLFYNKLAEVDLHHYATIIAQNLTGKHQEAVKFITSTDLLDQLTFIYIIRIAQYGNAFAIKFLHSSYVETAIKCAINFVKYKMKYTGNKLTESMIDDAKSAGVLLLETLIKGDRDKIDDIFSQDNSPERIVNTNTRKIDKILSEGYKHMFIEELAIQDNLNQNALELKEVYENTITSLINEYGIEDVKSSFLIINARLNNAKNSREKYNAWFNNANSFDKSSIQYKILNIIEENISRKIAYTLSAKNSLLTLRFWGTYNPYVWAYAHPNFNPSVFNTHRGKNFTTWLFGSIGADKNGNLKFKGIFWQRMNDWWSVYIKKLNTLNSTKINEQFNYDKFAPVTVSKSRNKIQSKTIFTPRTIFNLKDVISIYERDKKIKSKEIRAVWWKAMRELRLINNETYKTVTNDIGYTPQHILRLYKKFQSWVKANPKLALHLIS